jgi:NitT/TauT family transport system permease protein
LEHRVRLISGAAWRPMGLSWRDFAATLLLLALLVLLGGAARQMVGPFNPGHPAHISLSPLALPLYTLRTVLRMLTALGASLLFTLTYATLAAKSRRAEKVLIPVLDVLQSVPILGYLSFTASFFVSLFPGSALGPELAAIFAIFTSQAWNMAFSFYQALRTIPADLDDASRSLRASAWQRFWRLEVPFAMPGLVWNTMMSMSGGWFFVVASEAISVGNLQIALPGVGSYVARAIQERDLAAVSWALIAMTVAILVCDQLLFRPLVAWADKFRFEQTAAQEAPRSWMLSLMRRSPLLHHVGAPVARSLRRIARARLGVTASLAPLKRLSLPPRVADALWYGGIAVLTGYVAAALLHVTAPALSWVDVKTALANGALTFARVCVLIVLASLIWVPVGVAVGLRPWLTERIQPIAQFLAAFPANLLFPVAVFMIGRLGLSPQIWLSALMILGTQWYILFNVIAGAGAFPGDLREAAASFRVRPWRWWRQVVLPGILPYYITGAITAAGGAWNASIVAEAVSWGATRLSAGGLGAYIAHATTAGDYPRIALGIAVMSALVTATDRVLWRPLYAFAERRTRID